MRFKVYLLFPLCVIVCGGILNASNNIQYIKTTNDMTIPHQKCQWQINASLGQRILLKFEDFNLGSQLNCSYAYVELSEKISNKKIVIAKLCSTTQGLNKSFYSSGSTMDVSFYSQGLTADKGFKATFKQGVFYLLLSLCFR